MSFFEFLSTTEVDRTKEAIESLKNVCWAKGMLKNFDKHGGYNKDNMPLMFEIRFAHELQRKGITPKYEFGAGVNGSTIDFYIPGKHNFLIELVSIRESDAAKKATVENNGIYTQILSTNSTDPKQSQEGQMIKVQEKIGEKVFDGSCPIKFPEPQESWFNVILADMRGYGDFDKDDIQQICHGPNRIAEQSIFYWKNPGGEREPIRGLFETECRSKASEYIQKRIHFLWFIHEEKYKEDEISKNFHYRSNPDLLDEDMSKQIISEWRA